MEIASTSGTDPQDVLPQVDQDGQQTPARPGSQTPAELAATIRNPGHPDLGNLFPQPPTRLPMTTTATGPVPAAHISNTQMAEAIRVAMIGQGVQRALGDLGTSGPRAFPLIENYLITAARGMEPSPPVV